MCIKPPLLSFDFNCVIHFQNQSEFRKLPSLETGLNSVKSEFRVKQLPQVFVQLFASLLGFCICIIVMKIGVSHFVGYDVKALCPVALQGSFSKQYNCLS